jgi:hypothetical protein
MILHQGQVVYDQPRAAIRLETFSDTYRAITV